MEQLDKWILPVIFGIFIFKTSTSEATCYFSQEFQGEYVMQSSIPVGNGITYSTLNITDNSIPIWGNCHKRLGNNFLLMDNVSETMCIRCLHLKLRSTNVLQVFVSNQATLSKCFTNEDSAKANCPTEESILKRETTEILLFKTKYGRITSKKYCPIDGKYFVNYEKSNSPIKNECRGFNSTVDSCPSGSTLNFRLRGCTFDSYELIFDCMGYWKGLNDETFLVFMDHRYKDGQKPKYRCALYKQNSMTGRINMALSKDSTCVTELYNSTTGYENFILTPKNEEPWPAEASSGMCTFPKWMHGNWEHVKIDEDTMVYKDHTSFKTYTIKCVGVQEHENRYLIYSRTQCNEESYNCMRIANRSQNILEFQIGTNQSNNNDVFTLCSDENFATESWITQGRLDVAPQLSPGMCPILGEYYGELPDSDVYCGKMWSDCRAPELMYYQVLHCETKEIYEDRVYQCLGHWRESELLYTYTQRKDVAADTYECFVGSILVDNEIYIKEAGEHCQRDINPYKYGMKLSKAETYSCKPHDSTVIPPIVYNTTMEPTTENKTNKKHTTQKPWNFDNTVPDSNDINQNGSPTLLTTPLYLYIILYIVKNYL